MCGIAGIFGAGASGEIREMLNVQRHRGPDACGVYASPTGCAVLGHNRLSIIDLSSSANQPMASADGMLWLAFNGEIYNYVELRRELPEYPFRSNSDTEVLLAAYQKWGAACLDRLIGMFAFLLWDEAARRLVVARDRFGVKPLYYAVGPDGCLYVASEVKALHAAGLERSPDERTWATYLAYGVQDHAQRTFWKGISSLPGGHLLVWQDGRHAISCWYDLAERVADEADDRDDAAVEEEYLALLDESVALRFRSDVSLGINLSGGVDSSLLLALVHRIREPESAVKTFTFATGDPAYDELPWVRSMLTHTQHPSVVCFLDCRDVPRLAAEVQQSQDEPFAGVPTLAYARLFECAHREGVTVLLDGQGIDEQWAGYDYYGRAAMGGSVSLVQGTTDSAVRPDCLDRDFRALAVPLETRTPFSDPLRNLQYRDTRYTKLPRALRFNDRVSMRVSTELREPFLDHRLFELALRQPADRKIRDGVHKWLLRRIAGRIAPSQVVEAPKRPVQTPQREWLRTQLREWASGLIDSVVEDSNSGWFRPEAVRAAWRTFLEGSDNSFYVWQWISVSLLCLGNPG